MQSLEKYTLDIMYTTGYGYTVFIWFDAFTKGEGNSWLFWLAMWKAHRNLKKKLIQKSINMKNPEQDY